MFAISFTSQFNMPSSCAKFCCVQFSVNVRAYLFSISVPIKPLLADEETPIRECVVDSDTLHAEACAITTVS